MENMHISESRNLVGKEGENEVMLNQFKGQVGPGELIWVKLKRESWWPAQVVNENGILDSNKPRKKTAGEVLVRLYGSYKYLYTSPAKCYSELQTVLKQKNGNFFEIFQKSLEQDLPSLKRGKNNGQGSKKGIEMDGLLPFITLLQPIRGWDAMLLKASASKRSTRMRLVDAKAKHVH